MKNAENIINITLCDNQLSIVAVPTTSDTIYHLGRVGSGSIVDVSIELKEGDYKEPSPILNPGSQPVISTVLLPAGTYRIYYTGINSGHKYNFAFTLNGVPYHLLNGQGAAHYGYVWNHGGPEPSTIEVVIG